MSLKLSGANVKVSVGRLLWSSICSFTMGSSSGHVKEKPSQTSPGQSINLPVFTPLISGLSLPSFSFIFSSRPLLLILSLSYFVHTWVNLRNLEEAADPLLSLHFWSVKARRWSKRVWISSDLEWPSISFCPSTDPILLLRREGGRYDLRWGHIKTVPTKREGKTVLTRPKTDYFPNLSISARSLSIPEWSLLGQKTSLIGEWRKRGQEGSWWPLRGSECLRFTYTFTLFDRRKRGWNGDGLRKGKMVICMQGKERWRPCCLWMATRKMAIGTRIRMRFLWRMEQRAEENRYPP